MLPLRPSSAEELAEYLKAASRARQKVTLFGNNSKQLGAGPVTAADLQISTTALDRVLVHERNDLTISVEAGMRFSALQKFLQGHGQMIALDPPFYDDCTIGGVLASDTNGPLRRRFGTARDQVIGMTFATLDGRLIKAGGMVVKNVAGLDMAKLLIGSYGTLAAIASVNLRVYPKPAQLRTFVLSCRTVENAMERRNSQLNSVFQPWAIEMFSPQAAARLGRRGPMLAIRMAGSAAVMERVTRELAADEILSGAEDVAFWRLTSNFTSDFLARSPGGIVLRLGTPLSEIASLFQFGAGYYISHAGSGITYAYFNSWQQVPPLWKLAKQNGWEAVVAYAPTAIRSEKELWLRPGTPGAGNGFGMMEKLKHMFDPANLLNRSRLYGCV